MGTLGKPSHAAWKPKRGGRFTWLATQPLSHAPMWVQLVGLRAIRALSLDGPTRCAACWALWLSLVRLPSPRTTTGRLSTHQPGLAHNHLQPARVGNVADLLHYLRWRRAQVLSQRGDEVVAGRLELACHQEPSC